MYWEGIRGGAFTVCYPSYQTGKTDLTIYLGSMDRLIATARSNKVATAFGIQDASQLRKDYGKEQADVIMNIVEDIISGQVMGDTAKQLSELFGKIMQDRTSFGLIVPIHPSAGPSSLMPRFRPRKSPLSIRENLSAWPLMIRSRR